MTRPLLALSLFLSATVAFAGETVPAETEGGSVCPKEQATQEQAPVTESGKPAARPGTPAPARPRAASGSRGTPRWHSTLPGMFR